ncbi:ParB/Srx family N-terminal domain-containing protein [Xanthomonas vesicatoria]|uniref:Uncharacterized protein n=1 Tax=Xanthomonas vesicatoria ATCC 35937 TaxID=925775 RepID=F0BKZ4_9XANT|nr:ParB/Srx family N-terminal domain-containing protein [Xanthomonas vesicatoria]APP76835.1 hypothetical protein BJD12_18205 [Xanthomonas vesicatoria ATCC 35937]EGD06855.1 hypothetical protein XVE_4960 [Xanthomonas vesicatoria ATCC 35937]MCC8560285.1 ParB/Srx family N-terminal domain-containing protein [Xanthomonas vesicatoria]MCC8595565.1 ParB/Srx family N-terminal domain-containing protein [Xanthomonas vesicatoria]MCC8602814.1 ParB/Srx family N-terminal domain-containing protein [Xanthomonas
MPSKNVVFEQIEDIAPEGLVFDIQNPRLEDGVDGNEPTSEKEIIQWLRNLAALDELISSITHNGFKRIEPLVIHGPDGGPYTVLEGNRRLACIRLLKNTALADELGVSVPRPVPLSVLDSIQTVPVYRVHNPSDARAFIGFKHINGPHRWESFAKAKYVTSWWLDERETGLTINEIADRLGDDNNTIRNMIAGMLVLEQGKRIGFEISDRANKGRFAFSHLYTALSRAEYMDHLGLRKGWAQKLEVDPIPVEKSEELSEVLLYLYGSKSQKKPSLIKSQNPDLAHLGEALRNNIALHVLRGGASLQEARQEFRPPETMLNELLVTINLRLREATQLAARAETLPEALAEIAKEIHTQAKGLTLLVSAAMKGKQGQE